MRLHQVETQIDMIVLKHRQMQHRATGTLLDLGQHLAHPRLIGGGDDKPQVVMMLAFVVVIHFDVAADQLRHFFELAGRNRNRGKGAGAYAVRPEYRPDPAYRAARLKLRKRFQHLVFSLPQTSGNDAKGRRHQRKITLEIIEQMEFEIGHFGFTATLLDTVCISYSVRTLL